MSEPVKTIEGSHTLWYRIQHSWRGGDGPGAVMMEGVLMILMGLFFALLIPFSWLCEKGWRVVDRART